LYRPLVYNFLDNKFGRRLSLVLVPFYILILLVTSVNYKQSNYISQNSNSNSYTANNENYEDLLTDNRSFINNVVIQSKVITDPYIKVFVLFNENIENHVFDFNEGLKPEYDRRGLQTDIVINGNNSVNWTKLDSLKREYLKTFNSIYSVNIDSLKMDTEFILAKSPKNELGFETYLSTSELIEGKHTLQVNRLRIFKNDTSVRQVSQIPFWYFKDN
jgi:hypothetical protein